MLRLINVCKCFKYGKNKNLVLDNINISFKKNELVFILGSSGSGKSTLLNVIGGLLDVDSGKIMLDDRDITKFNHKMLCNYRNNMIGFIFQDYHLVEYMSVMDNVKLGQTIYNGSNNIESILRKLGIWSKRNYKVSKLSGGEKQRVAIARAIINEPDIILADEPTGALDSSNSIKIMNILKELSHDKLVIVVSHDNMLANKYSDRIININDGKIDGLEEVVCDDVKFKDIVKKRISRLSIIKMAIKNLMLKKWRTLFTSLAISLGFICLLLVLCLSRSFNDDIDNLEREIVSSFPISIYNGEYENIDIDTVSSNDKIIRKNRDIFIHTNMISKNYLDYVNNIDEISYIGYEYDISMPLISDRYLELDSKYMKIISDSDFILNNYDILYGNNINNMYDIVLKVDSNNNVDSDILDIFNIKDDVNYEDLIGRKLRVIVNDLYYTKKGEYYFVNNDNEGMYKNSIIELSIVGIVREKDIVNDNSYFYYDDRLIKYILNINSKSNIVLDQLDSEDNVLGLEIEKYNLLSYLGYDSLPSGINIYVSSIDDKDIVISKLDEYNKNNDKLIYIDMMKEAIDIFKGIINIVTVILIIFSFISIMVSSLMVFILTNNRIMERVREIGILRAIGARYRDISYLFNVENMIIGIISSVIGIVVLYSLENPINRLMGILLDTDGMFNIYNDLIVIGIIFNLFIVILSGYIPTKIGSKKKILDCFNGIN